MDNSIFKMLNEDEAAGMREWARRNYIPGSEVKSVFHPEIRKECEQMNLEDIIKKAARDDSYWHFKSEKNIGDIFLLEDEDINGSLLGFGVRNGHPVGNVLLDNGEIGEYDLAYLNSL